MVRLVASVRIGVFWLHRKISTHITRNTKEAKFKFVRKMSLMNLSQNQQFCVKQSQQ
jgi:hypothetical protein